MATYPLAVAMFGSSIDPSRIWYQCQHAVQAMIDARLYDNHMKLLINDLYLLEYHIVVSYILIVSR
jgi:hypothetical protein